MLEHYLSELSCAVAHYRQLQKKREDWLKTISHVDHNIQIMENETIPAIIRDILCVWEARS